MKAYPLIYSRTKNFDFVPDFLVRPAKLDCQKALKYVTDAMYELDFIEGIRYSAFSVGDYCICGGLSCLSKNLLDLIKMNGNPLVPDDISELADDFLRDCKGRKVACYIGIAIPKSEIKQDMIPDITPEQYWHIYLEYLRHQWASIQETSAETLELPPIELNEKKYSSGFVPAFTTIAAHRVIRKSEFEANRQTILDYIVHQIMTGADESLMTEIEKRTLWDKTAFRTTVVSDELFESLKSASVLSTAHQSAAAAGRSSFLTQKNDGEVQIQRNPQTNAQMPRSQVQGNTWDSVQAQKKTVYSDRDSQQSSQNASHRKGSLILKILAAVIILILLIVIIKVLH
ncbi:MAG: hypothetical protein IKG82_03975 [Oscillospiraceae bacterium]|nr:hypothetical protein [Oscillospiraceae bacterium]